MPVLSNKHLSAGSALQPNADTSSKFGKANRGSLGLGLIEYCSNPECCSGWLHLFRKRTRPVFEGGWTCTPACTEARVQSAVWRELEGRNCRQDGHRHRIPLGLLMLEKGWITPQQLRAALEAQRAADTGRLGEWLVRQHASDEATVTRALGVQWSCPVLSLGGRNSATLAGLMPRLFVDAFGALPVRIIAEKMLYIGFETSLDPVLALALERMTGLRVESGIVPSSVFRRELTEMSGGNFAPVQLVEAVSKSAAAHLIAKAVERAQPAEARLVRVHDFLWMRLFLAGRGFGVPGNSLVRDVVCTIKTPQFQEK